MIFLLTVSLYANFSIGIGLGIPTGLTGKYEFSESLAMDFGLSYNFTDFTGSSKGFYLFGDALLLFPEIIETEKFTLPFYVGAGAGYAVSTGQGDVNIGILLARVPVGIYYPVNINDSTILEPYFELVPIIMVTPIFLPTLQTCLGVRYRF